jgi:hypothetical protein
MNGRQAKKLRQLARRQDDKQMKSFLGVAHGILDNIVKPAPRFIPTKVWQRVAKVFLNI